MIEVGEYVRTRDGEIGKITSCYCRNEVINKWCFTLDIERWKDNECDNSYIVGEPSYNIIDLIEVGDYVNGHRICRIDNNITIWLETENQLYCGIYEKDIKTILTKEQYEANCYKVKEE